MEIRWEPSWGTPSWGTLPQAKEIGRPLAPAHQDPLKQQKREKERLKKQRAAQRAAEAAESGMCRAAAPLKHGPTPRPDDCVSAKHCQRRFRTAVEAAAAAFTSAGLPDFAVAAASALCAPKNL